MIICILGNYGSGKDTFADLLVKHLPNSTKIKSYTTRKPRYPDEDTHIFIPYTSCVCHRAIKNMDIPEYTDSIETPSDWLAYNIIDSNFYWTEKQQFDKNKYNIYVTDDIGLEQVVKSKFDSIYVIEINRPDYLIQVSEQRKQRKSPFKSFDYSFLIDRKVNNDKDIEYLNIQAHLIANDIIFGSSLNTLK